MLLWSHDKASFVDFADGYSYIHFIPVNFGIRPEEIQPADISILFHEFTHQLALKGPFGWLCAYFQSVRVIANAFSELQTTIEFPEAIEQVEVNDYFKLLSLKTFYLDYGDCLGNYYDLIDCYRWVLEGIALFVQFDYKSSTDFEAGSELFRFASEILRTEKFRFTDTDEMNMLDVNAFIDLARTSKHTSGLLQYFMENTRQDTAPYFLGYLMIKHIQRLLATKDERLQDPEVFFIFIQSYFFHDRELINLCTVEARQEYQKRLFKFMEKRIHGLVEADSEKLRVAINAICDYQNAPINYLHLDFATAVRNGKFLRWGDEEVLNKFISDLESYGTRLEQKSEFVEYHKATSFQDIAKTTKANARFTFDLLRYVMLSFKLKHMYMAILGYNLNEKYATITTSGINGTPLRISQTIPIDEFLPLLQDSASEQFEIARDNGPRMPPELYKALAEDGWKAFSDLLYNYYDNGKLMIAQDYDLYLIHGTERCRVWIRGKFLHIEPYHWEEDSDSHSIKSVDDLQMLKWAGHFFHHDEYLKVIRIPKIINGPGVYPDAEFGHQVLTDSWFNIFMKNQVSQKELAIFASQKGKVIAKTQREREFLRLLCQGKAINSGFEAEVSAINQRWRYFTGNDLVEILHDEYNTLKINLVF